MSKSNKLSVLYSKIELESTDDLIILAKLKGGNASIEEIDELLDTIRVNPNGGKILDDIKDFENSLITEIKIEIAALEEMVNEYYDDVANIEDKSVQNIRFADMKRRYKIHVANADEIIEAMRIAYFQIGNFTQYEDQLYNLKDEFTFFE